MAATMKDNILADIAAGKFLDNLTGEKIGFLRNCNYNASFLDKAEIIYALVCYCASFNHLKAESGLSDASTIQQSAVHSPVADLKSSADKSSPLKTSNENPGVSIIKTIVNTLSHIGGVRLFPSRVPKSGFSSAEISPFSVLAHRESPFDTSDEVRERIRMLKKLGFNINVRLTQRYNQSPSFSSVQITDVLSEAVLANNQLAFDALLKEGALLITQPIDSSSYSVAGNPESTLVVAYRFADDDFFQHILTEMQKTDAKLAAEQINDLIEKILTHHASFLADDSAHKKKMKLLIESPLAHLNLKDSTALSAHTILDGIIMHPTPPISPFWPLRGTVISPFWPLRGTVVHAAVSNGLNQRFKGLQAQLQTACSAAFPVGVSKIVFCYEVGQDVLTSTPQGNAFLCLATINHFSHNYLREQHELEKHKRACSETNVALSKSPEDANATAVVNTATTTTAVTDATAAATIDNADGAAADMKSAGDAAANTSTTADSKYDADKSTHVHPLYAHPSAAATAVAITATAADSTRPTNSMSMFSYFTEHFVDDAEHPTIPAGTASAGMGMASDSKSAANLPLLSVPQPAAILTFYNNWAMAFERERTVDEAARMKEEVAVRNSQIKHISHTPDTSAAAAAAAAP